MATIYDVAKAAGVSPKTVSRVINGDAPVNEVTRAAVNAAIAGFNYVPSSAAQSMRSHKSGLVGLVTGAISTSAAAASPSPVGLPDIYIVQGIQSILADSGITLLISDTGGKAERELHLFRTLLQHRVEGLIYVAEHHQKVKLPFATKGRRVVLVNCFDDAGTPCVVPDDMGGQEKLVEGLIERGHSRIGFLTLPESLVARSLRLQGYKNALARAGIVYDPSLVIMADLTGSTGDAELLRDSIDRLLSLDVPPTVLCCANDKMAMRVYGILRSRGITVPAEMSVAGYDDYRLISETLYPPLTTAELPYAAMGLRAGQLLLDLMRGEPQSSVPARQLVGGRVCWRESVQVRDPAIIHLNKHIGGM